MENIEEHQNAKKNFFTINYSELITKNLLPVSISAVIDKIIFHPLDTIITHQQNSKQSALNITRQLWGKGISSFYPGYLPNILSAIPIRLSMFSLYFFIKEQGQFTNFSSMSIMLFAGILTGLAEASILCPADSYRTRKTLIETAHLKYSYKFMFKGFVPLTIRTSVENTICLMGADVLLKKSPDSFKEKEIAPYVTGFAAGYASQFFSTPFDVIKTQRMKTPDKKLASTISTVLKEGNIFRSSWMKAARAGSCNAIIIGTSYFIKNHIEKRQFKNNLESTRKPPHI